jgi:hypothetical protein
MRAQIITAVSTNLDMAVGFKGGVGDTILIGQNRTISTGFFSVTANGTTSTSAVAVDGSLHTFEMWWTNDGKIYYTIDSGAETFFSATLLATGGNNLPAVYFETQGGAPQLIGYFYQAAWCWSA